MLKKRTKHFALLLVLTMLATMFVGIGTASASATYNANSTPALVKGTLYAQTGNAGTPFNRITVRIPKGHLTAATTVRASVPSGYGFIPFVPTLPSPGANQIGAVTVAPVAGTNETMPAGTVIAAPFNAAPYNNAVNREYDITVTPAAPTVDEEGVFYIDLYYVYVKAGADDGDLKVTFDAQPNSSLSSGDCIIGNIGGGNITLTMGDVDTVTSAGGAINTLKIKEDRAGALDPGANSVKIKLPNGFKWRAPGAGGTLIWGDATAVPAAAQLTRADNDRTLCINTPTAAGGSNAATYYSIAGLAIDVDESVAKFGDIVATISGDSSCKQNEITVGKYQDYSVKVEAFGDPKDVKGGRYDEEIGAIKISEGAAGSLVGGRTITLQLIGGAKWRTQNVTIAGISYEQLMNAPTIKGSDSKNLNLNAASNANTGTGNWDVVGEAGDTIKATVTATSTSSGVLVLQKGEIAVNPNATGEIKLKVGGTAGATGEIVVAKAVAPVSGSIEGDVKDVVIGQTTDFPDIVVTENIKEALNADANQNQLQVLFPYGIRPGKPGGVEVVSGDVQIDKSSLTAGARNDGRWFLQVDVTATSTTPSKIKFTGIKCQVDRTVPEGDILADVRGTAVVKTAGGIANVPTFFTGDAAFPKFKVAKSTTPAAENVKNEASFVIGSTSFKLNGADKTMDVAPYIKDSRTYMPLRYVAWALGVADANILWDATNQTVTLSKNSTVVQVKIGSKNLLVNGASITMDVAPEITGGRTMLPISFIANAFGATASWDAATQTVSVK